MKEKIFNKLFDILVIPNLKDSTMKLHLEPKYGIVSFIIFGISCWIIDFFRGNNDRRL